MNKKLLELIRSGGKYEELTEAIAKTGASEHELASQITDVETAGMVVLACDLLYRATRREFEQHPGFDTAYNLSMVGEGIEKFATNPASLNLVQTIMLLTIALLSEPEPYKMFRCQGCERALNVNWHYCPECGEISPSS